jgi:arylsulfatase A-like enzyme
MIRWVLFSLLLTAAVPQEVTKPPRPSIVILLADDLGFSDLGCYGSEISTPNLDRLAKGGLRFTQFYNTTRCCPSRASLLTGLYPHQAGMGHMVEGRPQPAYQGFLNDRCVTMAEVLRGAGYRTLMSGKWHVGEKRPHWPVDRGFDRYFGLISGASNYFKLEKGRTMAMDGEPWTPPAEGFYMTDAIADHAVRFIDEAKGKPMFLYVAFTAPHWPLHAPPEEIAKYRGKYRDGWDALRERRHQKQVELGIVDSKWPLTPRDEKAPAWTDVKDADGRDLRMAVYAAQVDRLDQQIGRILAKLDQNTLVFFLSDNGGCAEEIHRGQKGAEIGTVDSFESYGLPWANASNTPFRLYKHWVHEGGIATPLIVSWPAVIKTGGTITDQPGHLIDLMATCVDVAEAEYPKTFQGREITPLEGKSLVPVFRTGTREGHAAIFWEHEGNKAIRKGKWKLVARHKAAWELFDLGADRTEMTNLLTQEPERAKEMAAEWEKWAGKVGVEPWK